MTIIGAPPDESGAWSAVGSPTGPKPRVTASPEVIARLLSTDDIPLTRAERDARMPSPLRVAASALTILSVSLLGFLVYLGFVARLHHDRAQLTAYANFRAELALATAPVGQARPDDPSKPLVLGTAVALLEVPSLGLKEVVFEGTTAAVLEDGPGHMRSTPLPGQGGVSVIMGRAAMYGGPFSRVSTLAPGETFTITTGQGVHTYRVLGVRRAGDVQQPPLARGAGRLTLVTADGNPFVASGVLRVDADLTSEVQPRPALLFGAAQLSPAELPMAGDKSAWYPMVFVGEGLFIVACLAAWLRYAWGGPQTWLVALPLMTALGIATADYAVRLLPNLI